MTVLEVIQRSSEFLARKGVESPRLQVEWLLEKTLGMPRLKLYLNHELVLNEPQLAELRDLVKRRAARVPLQHLLGTSSFCGFEIGVGPEVLVPRPETELLAEQAWEFLRARGREQPGVPAPRVLDFGTGSGCLAIAIARHAPEAAIDAIDLSASALDRARANVRRHQLESRVSLHLGDGFAALPTPGVYDLIVSNPPYIPTAAIEQLEPEVRDHDPRQALDGGVDGLEFYRRLSREATAHLAPGARLMMEIGDGQESSVRELFQGPGWRVQAVIQDYSDRPRIVIACRVD